MESSENFTLKVEKEFDDIEPGTLTPDSVFREIQNWSSMHALIIIALVDTEYDVKITGEDIRNSQTINDIYTIVKSRAN